MSMSVSSATRVGREEWLEAAKSDPTATYFQTPMWAEIWQEYAGYEPQAWKLGFSNGQTAILPLSLKPSGGFLRPERAFLSAAGTYGGSLSTCTLDIHSDQAISAWLQKNYEEYVWRSCDKDKNIQSNADYDPSYIIDLSNGYEKIKSSWKKSGGAQLRKMRSAESAGVVIQKDHSDKSWADYFELYQKSLKRWGLSGTSDYRWPLFEQLKKHQEASLWVAKKDNALTCGALCFAFNGRVVYWHGVADSEYFKLRPVNLLMAEIIKKSCEDGQRIFDLNPSGRHANVSAFKKSLGAVEAPSYIYRKSAWYRCALSSIKERVA